MVLRPLHALIGQLAKRRFAHGRAPRHCSIGKPAHAWQLQYVGPWHCVRRIISDDAPVASGLLPQSIDHLMQDGPPIVSRTQDCVHGQAVKAIRVQDDLVLQVRPLSQEPHHQVSPLRHPLRACVPSSRTCGRAYGHLLLWSAPRSRGHACGHCLMGCARGRGCHEPPSSRTCGRACGRCLLRSAPRSRGKSRGHCMLGCTRGRGCREPPSSRTCGRACGHCVHIGPEPCASRCLLWKRRHGC